MEQTDHGPSPRVAPGSCTGRAARDRHLFQAGPKRILALDGGGTRGIVALGFLARLEAILGARHGGGAFRLSDYFDLIGGTSTGAIIAAGLALGMRVDEVSRLYMELAPRTFRRSPWRVPGLAALFNEAPLSRVLRSHLGDCTLDGPELRTGFAAMTKRMDTGSAWLVSNNPRAPFWDDPPDGSWLGNRHYPLASVVRASTAAPGYFRPEPLRIAPGAPPGLFVDGGVSPYNNPSLPLLMMATTRPFGLCWPTGPEALLLVSVGTGSFRVRMDAADGLRGPAFAVAARALLGMIGDGQTLTLALLQWMSVSPAPWLVNSELGDLAAEFPGGTPLLHFQRYDVLLESAWLAETLGVAPPARELEALRRMDNPSRMSELLALAARAAELQVQEGHFPAVFDTLAVAPGLAAAA